MDGSKDYDNVGAAAAGPAKSDFNLLVLFHMQHFFTCLYHIYLVIT